MLTKQQKRIFTFPNVHRSKTLETNWGLNLSFLRKCKLFYNIIPPLGSGIVFTGFLCNRYALYLNYTCFYHPTWPVIRETDCSTIKLLLSWFSWTPSSQTEPPAANLDPQQTNLTLADKLDQSWQQRTYSLLTSRQSNSAKIICELYIHKWVR